MQENITTGQTPAQSEGKGMTVKVIKGSFWVLMGQIVPLIATFIASPFVIRLLGSEAYGVLILVGVISTYFGFADFGMGMASTRFGAEAYGEKNPEKEGLVVRTSAVIAFTSSLVVAIPLFVFSYWITGDLLKIPEHLHQQASVALKITSIAFLCTMLSGVFNTPMLSRLRMDLQVIIRDGARVLMTLITPVALYLGGDIVDAIIVASVTAFIILAANIMVSGRLMPQLYRFTISKELAKPLLKFGRNYVFYGIGLILLNNLEKLLLARLVEVKSVGYYSIASTFANMTTMFSMAMVQTLIPAFSQLMSPEKRAELNKLFSRTLRLSLIGLLPSIMLMLVVAQPFFTVWAGKEYGENSVYPCYILLAGIFFSILVYIPNCILLSSGRSEVFARFYLIEIVPYAILTYFLISYWGIIGAALAWSIREIVNALFFIRFTKKYTGLSLNLSRQLRGFITGFLMMVPAALLALFYDNFSWWLILLTPAGVLAYFIIVWKKLVDENERVWVRNTINRLLRRKS